MARHTGCHAQPRIGVDIGGADKALRELVDYIVVLGQQLTGDIERHRIRPVLADDPAEALGDVVERGVPLNHLPVHDRFEQASFEADRLGERRTLAAQPAEIGRVQPVTLDADPAGRILGGEHAAADTAIGTSGLDGHARALS